MFLELPIRILWRQELLDMQSNYQVAVGNEIRKSTMRVVYTPSLFRLAFFIGLTHAFFSMLISVYVHT